jgi:hypothetical protein
MPKQSRIAVPSFFRFDGFPYLVTRVVPALYHITLLGTRLSDSELRALACTQVLANRLAGRSGMCQGSAGCRTDADRCRNLL